MIQANELRTGNWIMYYSAMQPLYNTVKEVLNDRIAISLPQTFVDEETGEESQRQGFMLLKGIHGIQLDTNKLKLCDFKHIHDNPRLQHFYVNTKTYHPFILVVDRGGRIYFSEHLEITSLHQLQNLFFAITGEELEVNL